MSDPRSKVSYIWKFISIYIGFSWAISLISLRQRIAREVQDVRKDKASLITVESVVADDLTHLKGTFLGPEGTPYEGGVFDVDIVVPPQYPFTALKMKVSDSDTSLCPCGLPADK